MDTKLFEVLNDYSLEYLPADPADLAECKQYKKGHVIEYFNGHDELVYVRILPDNRDYDYYQDGSQYF